MLQPGIEGDPYQGRIATDADGMAMLKAMASENDFQIWIERVADNDPMAVVIEDGSVANAIQAEAA